MRQSRLIGQLMIKFVLVATLFLFSQTVYGAAINIGHDCTDLGQIPDVWINDVKNNLHIVYQHTSHGSQLVTGMNALENYPEFGTKYEWSDNGSSGLDFDDYGIPGCADLSQGDLIDTNGVTPWVTATRNLLDNAANNHVNIVMWSWCSINGHDIQRYLDNKEILISEYGQGGSEPRAADHPVQFVFMTGHAQGQGETGFIYNANQQIRQHCIDNERILYDFADIESYDPDENYYYDRPMWDDLDYNPGRTNNWGVEWCTANSGTEIEKLTTGAGVSGYSGCGSCAHSGSAGEGETINCVLKGRAAWWMFARLAGWTGPGGDTTPPFRTNGQPNGELPAGTIQTNISLTTNENATCRWSAAQGTAYDSMTNTFSTTGGTSHSTNISGLSNGNSYTYCVRCQDTSNNANTNDYEITFSVAEAQSDTTPPTCSDPSPTGTLSQGTTSTTLSLRTNENATCRYSNVADTSYDSMTETFTTTGSTSHSTTVDGLSDGNSYTYCVRCRDVADNANTDDFEISFSVATQGSGDSGDDGGDDSSGASCFIGIAAMGW